MHNLTVSLIVIGAIGLSVGSSLAKEVALHKHAADLVGSISRLGMILLSQVSITNLLEVWATDHAFFAKPANNSQRTESSRSSTQV